MVQKLLGELFVFLFTCAYGDSAAETRSCFQKINNAPVCVTRHHQIGQSPESCVKIYGFSKSCADFEHSMHSFCDRRALAFQGELSISVGGLEHSRMKLCHFANCGAGYLYVFSALDGFCALG